MSRIKKLGEKLLEIFRNRTLMLSILIALVAIVYIVQLFNLQIVKGSEYREQSEKRMLRTEVVAATRGEITDAKGVVLATNKLSFNVKLYKVRVDPIEQNASIEKLIHILEQNEDKIYSTFPMNEELTDFNFDNEEDEKKWKKEMKIDETFSFEDTINYYIKKYALEDIEDSNMQKKIIKVKYEGNLNGYSLLNGVLIAKDISEKSHAQIEEQKASLYGVSIETTTKRYYPNGTLAAHVIGYVSKINSNEYKAKKEEGYNVNSVIGKSGIELSYEKYLRGVDGIKKVETDGKGQVTSSNITKEAISGKNVTLTIDYRLQKVAEEALQTTMDKLRDGTLVGKIIPNANSGSVVVLDVETGEVLAMVSNPSYDINKMNGITTKEWNALRQDPLNPMYNRAISGIYSPGSTYKMLVGMAGLMEKKVTVDEKIRDPGIYPYGHKPTCWIYSQYGTTHGYVNYSEAIKGSCNCYFYEVGRRIGISEIVKYSKIFGLGTKTGIELASEVSGEIAGEKELEQDEPWYLGQTLSAAIGQASSAYTPIQLANYIATIANGGNLNKVTLIKEVKNDNTHEKVSLEELNEYSKNYTGVDFEEKKIDIDASYIDAAKEGMLSVTNDRGGTASIIFKNSNIKVAGKTGTSQLGNGSNNGIFVGFAPYDKPKIAVVAIIENGGEGTYTANVVKPIMEEYFKISTEDKANEKNQNIIENQIKF